MIEKTKAQTDRIWTNLRQGRGTVYQQDLVSDIEAHPAFSLVKITKLAESFYHPADSSIREITKARTTMLRKIIHCLDSLWVIKNNET